MKRFSYSITEATRLAECILGDIEIPLLARNCPGLKTFDFQNYLACSRWRLDKTLHALDNLLRQRHFGSEINRESAQVLDFGAWLGNFAIALKLDGWQHVAACDMWARYSPALNVQKATLALYAVDTIDTTMIVGRPQGPRYDVVLLMGVIEHIADSPRKLLKILNDCLKPGGFLILDTPNLAYLPNRRRLNRGQSPYTPIEQQFETESPFEGHVREYTASELHWMLNRSGFDVLKTEFFNYSPPSFWQVPFLDHIRLLFPPYCQSPLIDYLRMTFRPDKRELIFMVARKK